MEATTRKPGDLPFNETSTGGVSGRSRKHAEFIRMCTFPAVLPSKTLRGEGMYEFSGIGSLLQRRRSLNDA
jgi:hypothetical protein